MTAPGVKPAGQKARKPKKPTAARSKIRATHMHSVIVRSRGACENCGARTNLQCAHIVSRRYAATRTDLTNAFCLDAACHMRFTEWPMEFAVFVLDHIGLEKYDALKWKAEQSSKVDWAAEVERLLPLYEMVLSK